MLSIGLAEAVDVIAPMSSLERRAANSQRMPARSGGQFLLERASQACVPSQSQTIPHNCSDHRSRSPGVSRRRFARARRRKEDIELMRCDAIRMRVFRPDSGGVHRWRQQCQSNTCLLLRQVCDRRYYGAARGAKRIHPAHRWRRGIPLARSRPKAHGGDQCHSTEA